MSSNKQTKRGPVDFEVQEEPIIELIELIEEIDKYNEIRSAFRLRDNIPLNSIPIIMKHYFKSSEKMLEYNAEHVVYKIMIKDLLKDFVENWIRNRPPDMARIDDIATSIYKSSKSNYPFETMIYLSFNKENEKFDILDGIHRITALKLIKEENSKPAEHMDTEPQKFSSGNDANSLFNQYILVTIRFNATEGDLSNTFQNLNKSRPVPQLYMGNQPKDKIEIINNIANQWCHKYKKNFSKDDVKILITGNTTRDKFVDLLDKLYDKHQCKNENKLRDILDKTNENLSLNNHKVSIKVLEKCKETGCYLFLLKNDKLLEKY